MAAADGIFDVAGLGVTVFGPIPNILFVIPVISGGIWPTGSKLEADPVEVGLGKPPRIFWGPRSCVI